MFIQAVLTYGDAVRKDGSRASAIQKRAPAKILILPCRGSQMETATKGKRKIFVGRGAIDF